MLHTVCGQVGSGKPLLSLVLLLLVALSGAQARKNRTSRVPSEKRKRSSAALRRCVLVVSAQCGGVVCLVEAPTSTAAAYILLLAL